MKNLFLLLILFITTSFSNFPQVNDESWKIFSDNSVARVDIYIDPASLEWIYNNVNSDSLHLASMHYTNNFINEDVDSIGFRLRGNTSRDAQKKSFKISFNTYVDGREFYGLDKLNLNGEHNDPSIIRSKLCFDLYNDIGMKASRAIHTEVYINGQYYGLYISVEHIDDEFLDKNFEDPSGNLWKCLYPADLVYLGEDPSLYKLTSGSRPVYELSTNEETDDYTQLARLIKIINNTPNNLFADSIEKFLEVPEVLKYLSFNTLVAGWDDYRSLTNNYYLYHNPTEDKFHWIPYDYDNTFGIDWSGNDWVNANPYNYPMINEGPRPLVSKLMAKTQYRNLYTHFLEFYREKVFKLNLWQSRIDSIKNLITPYVEDDSFRTLDYGFTMIDFNQSYTAAVYSNQHVKKGIKQFVNERYNSLPAQLNYLSSIPIVYDIKWTPEIPSSNDSIYVTIAAFSNEGLTEVSIHYTPTGSGTENIFPMSFQPVNQTKIVEEADRWIGVIPPIGSGNSGSFKIFAKDNNQNLVSYPRHKSIFINSPVAAVDALVINEFSADNDNVIADSAGDYDDWVEIFNPTPDNVSLSGMYLTDKPNNLIKWQFPENISIGAGEYLIVWCDEEQEEGSLHTNFGLSNDGEFVGLTSSDGITVIDSITFGPQSTDISYGRFPDASANWQFFNSPTPGSSNNSTGVDEQNYPLNYELTAYPNPFNPVTIIRYAIPQTSFVNIKVFDILGNEITTLINEEKPVGIYEINFNASYLSSGVYFYSLETGNYTSVKKLILLK
ncbi:MAG TPA: CotH kinase family protein [Ignavibacteriaceae bacterium]|nr:CotH kinase family protein [Ignavibacteriaceae bacterium]